MPDPTAGAFLITNPGGASKRFAIKDLKVEMAPYAHTMAQVIIRGIDDTEIAHWDTGQPVAVQYGRRPKEMTTFYGYMLTTAPKWSQTMRVRPENRHSEVWVIGASWPMKNGLSWTFSKQTSPQIVRSVAGMHGLDVRAPVSVTDRIWSMKNAVNGESEWEFLVKLAKDTGRTCHVVGTQVAFYDPSTLLVQPGAVIPAFYEKDSGKGASVLEFHVDNAEVSGEHGRRKRTRVIQGLTNTGAPHVHTDDGSTAMAKHYGARYRAPLFTENVAGMVTHSQADAMASLPALSTENRFYLRAHAKLRGDVRVTQDSPVVIEGVGVRDSGLWHVIKVTHKVGWQWYSMECELGRDSDFDNGIRPVNANGVTLSYLGSVPTASAIPPPTVLSNGQWRSAYYS